MTTTIEQAARVEKAAETMLLAAGYQHLTEANALKCAQALHEAGMLVSGWRDMADAPAGKEVIIRTDHGCVSCTWDAHENEWGAGWLGIALLPGEERGWLPLPTEDRSDG